MNINRTTDTLPWTEARVSELKKLWTEGKSATEIANTMKGATRAAVIGKVHRLGLAGRGTPENLARRAPSAPEVKRDAYAGNGFNARGGKPKAMPMNLSKSKTDSTPEQRAEHSKVGRTLIEKVVGVANDNAIPLLDRRFGQCSWPVGTPERPAEQMCCGKPIAEDANRSVASYCPDHGRRAVSRTLAGGKPDPDKYERAMRRWAA